VVTCQSCGNEVAAEFAFCPHCGAAIGSPHAAGEERKLVTLLFADITGSTQLAEVLDPEVVRELMGEYFALAREEIEARGGTVEKFIGDAVMAVFGVPVVHEDDPVRALQAALAIRTRLEMLNTESRTDGRPELQVRIGVNTGAVVATTSPRPTEGMVTGDAVNVAARIQQMAEPGQIMVGGRTAAAAKGFAFRDLGVAKVRGKSAEVGVRELLAESADAAPRGIPGLRAPLVGRDSELDFLTTVYERVVAERQPHLVTLYGQPGVGKSRLTVEFLALLGQHTPAPTVLRGRCLPYGTGVTFWPLAEILKSQASILDSDPPADVLRKLLGYGERVITATVAHDPARVTALLGYTVGIPVLGYEFGRLDPEQLRTEVHGAWRSMFSALASDGPLVVVVDDIHWADGALLDLLEEVGARVEGSALFLCPSRPELANHRPGWGGGGRSVSSITLDPLPPAATVELVDALLEVADLPDELRARIVERAEGNPFFVEEILRQLIDEGRLVRVENGWRSAPGIGEVDIPDTVQAVLAARIDLLGGDQKRALQAAAVVGRVFWPAPVARSISGSSASLDAHLRELETRDLIRSRLTSTMAGQPEYIFKHALVRDVAYESIPRRDRAAAHLRVAEWIEDVIGERRIEVVELLAHHYTEAERAAAWAKVEPRRREEIRARAVELLFAAGEEASRHLAIDRARERLRVGLDLAQGPIERARGLEILARVQLWATEGDDAWRSAREAIELRMSEGPATVDERRAVARTAGTLLSLPTRWPGMMRHLPSRDEALPYLELGMSMLDDADSEERLRLLMAEGAWGWGFAEADTDPERVARGRAAADAAVAMARRLGRPELLSAALDTLGAARAMVGGYRGATESQEERLRLVPQLDDALEIIDIYGTMAWGLTHIGDFPRAAEMAEAGWARSIEFRLPHSVSEAFFGVASYRLGRWGEFWRSFESVEADFAGLADPATRLRYHSSRLYGLAAYLSEIAGDSPAADRHIALLDRVQAVQGDVGISGPRLWVVQCLIRRGAFAEARRRLAVEDPVRSRQNRDLDLEAWADLVAAEGTWDEAPRVLAEARSWAEETGLTFLPAIADRLEGQAAIAAGQHETGAQLLERAAETFTRLEARWERARTGLALAQAHLAVGRRPEAAAEAQAALAVFTDLGAVAESGRATVLAREASEAAV
jgi:class 3 adenylate cyclase/tetratricopeptide (TPR) repeat protein